MSRDGGRPDESSVNRKNNPVRTSGPRLTERALKIRKARNASGLSQAALAKLLDCSPGAVGQWELGMTSPDKTKLVRLTELLDISLDDLLGSPDQGNASMAVASAVYGHGSVRTGAGAVELDSALIDQARRLGIDVPTALTEHLRALVARTRSQRWLEENREAIADANTFLVRYGLWSDGKRQF
jgi:antitoxin CcdA